MSLEERIRRRALDLGFDPVGIGSAEPFPDGRLFRRWLAAGHAAEMRWLHRDPERRADPGRVVDGARSVLVVGLEYDRGDDAVGETEGPTGSIARYARGDDYHRLMERRLKTLLTDLPEIAGRPVRGRWYVDTGPVLERAAAARAGLGFIGKNTCLIAPRRGSYLFLGALILDLDLEPDGPAIGGCGTCTACLDACPTTAFPEPFVLDARLCLSYWTIEHRGPIPPEMRPAIGTMVFGCDVCQEVCPWNRFATGAADPALAARSENVAPALITLLSLDDEGFRERFPRSAVRRAKRAGLVRNVAVALGNAGDRGAVPALARALSEDPDPVVRGHAAWALGRLGGREAGRALDGALASEADAGVLSEIEAASEGR